MCSNQSFARACKADSCLSPVITPDHHTWDNHTWLVYIYIYMSDWSNLFSNYTTVLQWYYQSYGYLYTIVYCAVELLRGISTVLWYFMWNTYWIMSVSLKRNTPHFLILFLIPIIFESLMPQICHCVIFDRGILFFIFILSMTDFFLFVEQWTTVSIRWFCWGCWHISLHIYTVYTYLHMSMYKVSLYSLFKITAYVHFII